MDDTCGAEQRSKGAEERGSGGAEEQEGRERQDVTRSHVLTC